MRRFVVAGRHGVMTDEPQSRTEVISAGASGLVGLIGLGLVGRALAKRLRSAGFATLGYDLDEAARQRFIADGGSAVASITQLGRQVEQVVLAVFDSQDVLALLDDAQGLLAARKVRTIIDCTTGDPHIAANLADRLAAQGVAMIEAPWSGSSEQIAAGQATLLLAGDAQAIVNCEALLQALSAHRIVLGAAGMAARAKLATNLVLGLNRAALAEGFAFAERLGISRAQFLELVLSTPASSAAATIKGPMMVSGDFTPQSRIRQHLKDVELMIEAAHSKGLELPLSATHHRLLQRAVQEGDGDLDNAAIVRQWRDR